MGCRAQWSILAKCGQWARVLPAIQELHKFQVSRAHQDTRIWVPITGQSNRVIIESDFESMAAFEKEMDALSHDKQHFELREAIASHSVDGSHERTILKSLDFARMGHITGR